MVRRSTALYLFGAGNLNDGQHQPHQMKKTKEYYDLSEDERKTISDKLNKLQDDEFRKHVNRQLGEMPAGIEREIVEEAFRRMFDYGIMTTMCNAGALEIKTDDAVAIVMIRAVIRECEKGAIQKANPLSIQSPNRVSKFN